MYRVEAGRLLRSELLMVFRRRRNIAILVVLSLIPVLIGTAVKISNHPGRGGGAIFGSITDNGLFAALAAYLVVTPLFLPLGVAVVAGDSIAGEAHYGTLRYLLTVPVGRTRLLAVKFGGLLAWCVASVVGVGIGGVVIGWILFPSGRLTLLSGRTISYSQARIGCCSSPPSSLRRWRWSPRWGCSSRRSPRYPSRRWPPPWYSRS